MIGGVERSFRYELGVVRLGDVGGEVIKCCTSIEDSLLASAREGFGTIEAICVNVDGIKEVLFAITGGDRVTLDGGGDAGIYGVDRGYATECEIA